VSVCERCGLPEDLCVCESIAKETQKITIKTERKKFGKKYTIIEGFDVKEIDVQGLSKELKHKLACGGTYKDSRIELQGDHKSKVKEFLLSKGFAPNSVIVK
jgi:translation initiation factor 1